MVNALTSDAANLQTGEIHQFLHGYSDGHRLIESSVSLPSELARLMLKMSDLSGSNVVSGFERYITGYPLVSIDAYALAMTWYAPEMPRPGCVWTHTIVLSTQRLATISSLVSLTKLFKRPERTYLRSDYAETIHFESSSVKTSAFERDADPVFRNQLESIFSAYYGSPNLSPVVLVAQNSDEFSDAIFALWSQQWPRLRQKFSFCTGSLSGRSLDGRALDIQCSPPTAAKDVAREASAEPFRVEPILIPSQDNKCNPHFASTIDDAVLPSGGAFRTFLWASVDDSADRNDVLSFTRIYDVVSTSQGADDAIYLVAKYFPEPNSGARLKELLFGSDPPDFANYKERDILFSLATTPDFRIFDFEALSIDSRVTRLCASKPNEAQRLLRQLFQVTVNDLGETILPTLIVHMDTDTAKEITQERPKFLPGLFRAKPDLARSPELWKLGGDRKRELFEAVVGQKELDSSAIQGIVAALLDSNSDGFLRRSIDHWGKDAVFSILDWVDSHEGRMSRASRDALSNQPDLVMDWVQQKSDSSPASVAAVAHVVAPYASRISKRDSAVWLRTFRDVQGTANDAEKDYLASFLLTLAFCNAPPAPLDLVAESYQRVHQSAWEEMLSDEAWSIVEPFVPELSWWKNWDKCERLNRGLIAAFIRYRWHSSELRRVKNYCPRNSSTDLMQQIFQSARDVKGGKELVRNVERDA
ncbi:MAG: hypothetical protein ACRD4X_12565 [Candidatus Acidiferrales bacterium]